MVARVSASIRRAVNAAIDNVDHGTISDVAEQYGITYTQAERLFLAAERRYTKQRAPTAEPDHGWKE